MGLSVLDTDRRVWQRPCVKHKQARAWPELKEAPRAARGQGVNPPTKKKNRARNNERAEAINAVQARSSVGPSAGAESFDGVCEFMPQSS